MNLEKQVARLVALDRMINQKSTGTPKEIAQKMNVSESTVFRLLRTMKENLNREFIFDRHANTYVYVETYGEIDFKTLLLAVEQ